MASRSGIAVGLLVQACCVASAWAAHPLQTEDTGTQGAGNVEFENGLASARSADSSTASYQPQFSFGMTPTFDLIVQPSLLSVRSKGMTTRGWGDTNLDGKWRFFGQAPISLALRAGVAVATGEHGLGNPHGQPTGHAVLVATWDAAPLTFHGNIGRNQTFDATGAHSQTTRVSAAAMWARDERTIFTVDAGTESAAGTSKRAWHESLLVGLIYSARPSLDLDIGYQRGTSGGAGDREWLAGITYRFSL